ncbi:methyltransferase domain-containing protein [Microdochium trichocladiopsis]|uniref:Methyltransferase domain-containing protein n=1 Tax=Microdochium trichocladiopsis TaxID=1682393 RepID=A0A9P8XY19_9PEZI|nr:methyltransferase domain-containing protein [Microdochium trichocladiopsis]KAH7021512.1 methyltransferase domain-containing protein [Microdochium trichocladiopsis]
MITLPGSYSNIDTYAEDLSRFIDSPLFRQITGDIHVNDALIYNAWEALPAEWTAWWSSIPDHRLVQQDLVDSIEELSTISPTKNETNNNNENRRALNPSDRPESLTTWLRTMQSLSLPRSQRPGPTIDLPPVLTGRMKTKKIAEVSTAAAYIHHVCETKNITHIIDMGSGQGYLCVSLAYLFPHLRILAIDGSETQLAASRAAAASLGVPEQRIQHLRRFIEGGGGRSSSSSSSASAASSLTEEMAAWAAGEKCMLVGLHACGNLSEHMLRFFVEAPFITCLGTVGCCYNHIVPRSAACPDGFPISEKMRGQGVQLSATALMTGCQAPNNWERADLSGEKESSSDYSKRRLYRAVLEKILFDKGIEVGGTADKRPVWGVRKGDMDSLASFTRRAVSCLGIDGVRITDEELAAYEDRYRGHSGRIAILWTLSVMCCKIVESVIALDRYLFLTENGGEEVEVLPIFDYRISPRNLMLIACKNNKSNR